MPTDINLVYTYVQTKQTLAIYYQNKSTFLSDSDYNSVVFKADEVTQVHQFNTYL